MRRHRTRVLAVALLPLLLATVSGCSTTKRDSLPEGFELRVSLDAFTWVVVGIEDLRPADLEAALADSTRRPPDVTRPDVWISGTGIEAAASAVTFRPAIEHLRTPRRVAMGADDVSLAVRGASASLRSAHGFTELFGDVAVIDDDDLASLPITDDVHVQLVLLDAEADLGAVLDAIDAWSARVDDTLTVKVFGFPSAIDDPRRDLRVPIYEWQDVAFDEPIVVDMTWKLHEALWGAHDPTPIRAAWPGPDDRRGGVFASDGALSVWSGPEGFVFAADPPAADTRQARAALTTGLADALFGGTPRAWIAVRGSEAVDFVDFSLFAHMPLSGRLVPWALEDIDNAWTPNDNAVRYSLGAEDRADGVVLDLGWPPYRFEVRLTGALQDAIDEHGWLGTPMYLGPDATSWGFGALVVEPWSRAFWLASARAWPDAADDWWPTAPVGVHVMIDGAADAPAPATFDEVEVSRER